MEIHVNITLRLRLEDTGREFTTDKYRVTIGRSQEYELSFPESRALSRRHAELFFRNGTWYLTDCGSLNGTWLNNRRLAPGEECALKHGDVIDLAHAQRILFVEVKNPVNWREDTVTLDDVQPVEAQPQWCDRCGSPVSGMFCRCCGARVGGPATPPPMPAPSMAPSRSMAPPPMPAQPSPSAGMAPPPAPSMAPSRSMAPAPKKKGLFSRLFGGKDQAAPAPSAAPAPVPAAPAPPQPAHPAQDDVQFRGTAPEAITPGEYFPVKIMMYREDDYQRADRESAAVADRTKSASSSVFQAEVGQEFRIALQSPDIELDCEPQQLRWNGKFAAADFEVYLPEDYDRRQLRLRGRVYSGDAVLTDLKLILQVGAAQPQNVVCEKVRLRSAFISYASADRAKVVARIQGIQLACPDMDLFFDVESLRRGESWENRLYQEIAGRDLFYLFWSQNAATSEWVKKELQYALSRKTVDFIEPIPLEGPEVCPPPESLMGKHFNDWTLRYLSNQ